jgi:hypothetical protein
MGSILAVLFAWVAQLQMLPMGMELQQKAAQTATMITTAQQETTILAAAGPYIQQNLTTVEASATAGTPYTISIAQLAAANIGPNGLPASFSATNPYGQTWQVQVLQPTAGNLQALVVGINGAGSTKLTDMQAAGIAGYAGQPGGFVPQNDSGIYPTGRVYGNKAGWGFATTGYQNLTGGQPAALLVINNGQQQNLALYRVAVPGQPQLNTMSTNLSMGGNTITNALQVQTASGNGIQVGSSYYYGDGSNSAIRQNGALYIQNQAGTAAADIASVGNVTSSGQVTATTVVANGNIWASNGTVTAAAIHSTGNAQVDGNLTTNGQITSGGYIAVNGAASQGAACPGPQYIGTGPNGPLFCKNGTWQPGGFSNFITRTASFAVTNGGRDSAGTSYCNANETLLSGGVSCPSGDGLAFLMYSYPNGNGWFGFCGDASGTLTTPSVYALCAS